MLLNTADKQDIATAMRLFQGENLRKVRLAAVMSQAELAASIGTAQPIISLWENGAHRPRAISAVTCFNVLAKRIQDISPHGAEFIATVLNSNA